MAAPDDPAAASAARQTAGRTWDGLAIAPDHPTGASVVLRRWIGGRPQVLLLHRAHHGPDFEGDWAWTSPAGCRQPGEAVYPAALRELGEEAGITGVAPWAVDCSARWALFAVDVEPDLVVDLVDPEHDRFEWVEPAEAARRVLPTFVGDQQAKAVAAASGAVTLGFRAMTEPDLSLLAGWRRTPHIQRWWGDQHCDDDAIRGQYLPRIQGDVPIRMWVVLADDRPVGFAQDYRLAEHPSLSDRIDQPAAVGIDYAIGDAALLGAGLGTRLVWQLCRDVVVPAHPGATGIVASPNEANLASRRVLAKCGFVQTDTITAPADPGQPETERETVCVLDVPHWLGSAPSA